MSPVNSMFVCIIIKNKIIGKSVLKMADIDNRPTPSLFSTDLDKIFHIKYVFM